MFEHECKIVVQRYTSYSVGGRRKIRLGYLGTEDSHNNNYNISISNNNTNQNQEILYNKLKIIG